MTISLERLVRHVHRLAGLRERLGDLRQVVPRDLAHLVVRQRREQHHLVDAVAELGREPAFELAHHFALHLFDADRAVDRKPSGLVSLRKLLGTRGSTS